MDDINKVYNDLILESYIKKIQKYVENFECACISASRNKLINITNNTIIPTNKQVGDNFTKEENRHRNTALKSCLLKLGYGVTSLDGRFAEAGGKVVPGRETSYFVVNLNNDPNFYKNLFELSEKFNQDAFLYKPIKTMNAILVGTNSAERNEEWGTPGYNQTIEAGEFNPNGFEGALSKMGNKAFQFRLNTDKDQANTFIGNEILAEETFNKLSIIQKDGCTKTAKKIFNFIFKENKNKYENIVNKNGNAYSASKHLYAGIKVEKNNIQNKFYTQFNGNIITEAIINDWTPDKEHKGGIIVFSTEVNAIKQSSNIFINFLKKKIKTIINYFTAEHKIDLIAKEHELIGWTVGRFLHGRYTSPNEKFYSENSMSVEIIGVTFDELVTIAEEICRQLEQESVLVKDYSDFKIVFVNGN